MPIIPKNLIDAYTSTEFRVDAHNICIRIGSYCSELDDLLKKNRKNAWAFITAYNPGANQLAACENEKRHVKLIEYLKYYKCFEGYGKGKDHEWFPEKSFLVIGISKSNSIDIGEKVGQNAIVFGRKNEPAELILLK